MQKNAFNKNKKNKKDSFFFKILQSARCLEKKRISNGFISEFPSSRSTATATAKQPPQQLTTGGPNQVQQQPSIAWARCGTENCNNVSGTLCDTCSTSLCHYCALRRQVCYYGHTDSSKSQMQHDFELITQCLRCYNQKKVPADVLYFNIEEHQQKGCLIM